MTASGRSAHPLVRLSPGEPFYPRVAVLSVLNKGDEFHLTIPHVAPQHLHLKGEEFLVKIIVVGKDMPQPARKLLRMGRRNNEFYVFGED